MLPISGEWISIQKMKNETENDEKQSVFTFYEDMDNNIIGHCEALHICRIDGRILRPKQLMRWETKCNIDIISDLDVKCRKSMLQFEQRWTEYSIHPNITTICTGVINDTCDEMNIEYVTKHKTYAIYIHRGHNILKRVQKSNAGGCMSGNWRLFTFNDNQELSFTSYFVEEEVFAEQLSEERKQTIFDMNVDGVLSDMMDMDTERFDVKVEAHQRKERGKNIGNAVRFKNCLTLTHFANDKVEGYITDNFALCDIYGRVYAHEQKIVLIQFWKHKSPFYGCITRIVGHFDDSCTRICARYQLLYKLKAYHAKNENKSNIKIEVDDKKVVITDSKIQNTEKMCKEERSVNELQSLKVTIKRTEDGSILLINDHDQWLQLQTGNCLYFRDFIPHSQLDIPYYGEFYDKSTEHNIRHMSRDYFGSHMEGVRLMPGLNGSTDYSVYHPNQNILILGEADFSFTLGMIIAANSERNQNENNDGKEKGMIIGTSYLCRKGPKSSVYGPQPEYLVRDRVFRQYLDEGSHQQLYETLREIWERGGKFFHGVDAREITATLRSQQDSKDIPAKFDCIIFPFPRASLRIYDQSLDHDLISGLFSSARKELSTVGELHLILHTSREGINQLDNWEVREQAEKCGYVWRASLPFDWRHLPPYHPKDVKNHRWNPWEATIHIFSPKDNEWLHHSRRTKDKEEMVDKTETI